MWKKLILPLILPLLAAVPPIGTAQAADEVNVSKGGTLVGPGLAAHGYDVVAYFTEGKPLIGSDAYAVAHEGGTSPVLALRIRGGKRYELPEHSDLCVTFRATSLQRQDHDSVGSDFNGGLARQLKTRGSANLVPNN